MGISTRESRTVFSPRSGPADRELTLPDYSGLFTTESSRDPKPGKVLPRDSDLPYWYSLVLFRPFGRWSGRSWNAKASSKPGAAARPNPVLAWIYVCFLLNSQALRTAASRSWRERHPSFCRIFVALATNSGGSPGRRGTTTSGIGLPVTR